jgi:hypothetical protein
MVLVINFLGGKEMTNSQRGSDPHSSLSVGDIAGLIAVFCVLLFAACALWQFLPFIASSVEYTLRLAIS